jgi:hypothetical protein
LNPARVVKSVYEVGITYESLWSGDVFDPVLRPQAAFVAEGPKPAFRRYSGARQNDDPFDLSHPIPFSLGPELVKSRT